MAKVTPEVVIHDENFLVGLYMSLSFFIISSTNAMVFVM